MLGAQWTPAAKADLLDIGYYIGVEQHRPMTAEKILRELYAKCDQYAENPLIGTEATHLGDRCRTFPYKRWVVIYRPLDIGIQVLRIFDGARGTAGTRPLRRNRREANEPTRSRFSTCKTSAISAQPYRSM